MQGPGEGLDDLSCLCHLSFPWEVRDIQHPQGLPLRSALETETSCVEKTHQIKSYTANPDSLPCTGQIHSSCSVGKLRDFRTCSIPRSPWVGLYNTQSNSLERPFISHLISQHNLWLEMRTFQRAFYYTEVFKNTSNNKKNQPLTKAGKLFLFCCIKKEKKPHTFENHRPNFTCENV